MWFDKDTRQAFSVAGLCCRCGQRPAREGRTECEACVAWQHGYLTAYRTDLKSAGLCVEGCGRQAAEGRSGGRCPICRKKAVEGQRRLYTERRSQGLCTRCGAVAVPGQALCGPHRVDERACQRARYRQRQALA